MCSLRLVSCPQPLIILLVVFLSHGTKKHRHVQFVPFEFLRKTFRKKNEKSKNFQGKISEEKQKKQQGGREHIAD